jgi:hypothetical protein
MSTATSMRNRRNIAVNLLKDTFQILNRDLIDGYKCQLRRLSVYSIIATSHKYNDPVTDNECGTRPAKTQVSN